MRSDSAHKWADRRLAAMEKRIEEIYAQAQEEVDKKLSDFTAQFQAKAKQKLADMKAGKIDAEEYKRWLRTQLFITDEWKLTRGMLADEYIHANQTALAYINGNMPEVWAVGYNAIGDAAESAMAGYTFHMVDAETVRLLTTDNSLLLPPPTKKLNLTKDERWNLKKINNQIRQGILQGESIGQIASRLQKVTDMNRTGALRNARTMVTAAENRGRMSSYERLERDGATMEREWIAAIDRRTRHAHQVLDGQKRRMGEAFVYDGDEIEYPGDPSAKPYLVYNCRCTVSAEVVAYKGRDVRTSYYEKGKEGDGTEVFEQKRDEAEKRRKAHALTKRRNNVIIASDKLGFRKIKGAHNIHDDIGTDRLPICNPNWQTKDLVYTNNCGYCTVAYEMRRRGFDVIARPKDTMLLTDWLKLFKDVSPEKSPIDGKADHLTAVRTHILSKCEEGARGGVFVQWEGENFGHFFSWEINNGDLLFVDAQCGRTDVSWYFAQAEPTKTVWTRLDDRMPTKKIKKACLNRGGKTK